MLKALTVLLTQAFLYQGFYVVLAEYWKSRVNNFIIFCTMIGVSAMLYFLRHKVNKLPLFLLAHIALAALCLYTRTPQAVILLVMTVISLIRRLTDRREQPEIYQMVLLCALYIASIHFKLDVARSWIYWMFFGMIPCHIFFHNLDATDQFIRFRRTTTSMDEKKLRHMNLGITTIFTTIVAGILLFAGLSPIDRWAGSLWNLILEGVKAFLRFLASFREEQAPPEILETLEETAVQPGGMPPM
ncbi:MAG: hypothetical protein K5682_02660, partial [Lachnospiraceae bacterium]|nr:hypothetical protein [Lachnospiraceae bacterium]